MLKHIYFKEIHVSLNSPPSNIWNLYCSNILLSVRISGLCWIKEKSYMKILRYKIFSNDTIIQFIQLLQILHLKWYFWTWTPYSFKLNQELSYRCCPSCFILAFFSFAFYIFKPCFRVMVNALLQFTCQLVKKTTSKTYGHSDIGYGFNLLVFKQRDIRIKLVRKFPWQCSSYHTNIIWYDVESQQCKITGHCVLDEGFNNFPAESLCLNAQHLLCLSNSPNLKEIKGPVNESSELELYIYQFSEKQTSVVNFLPTKQILCLALT